MKIIVTKKEMNELMNLAYEMVKTSACVGEEDFEKIKDDMNQAFAEAIDTGVIKISFNKKLDYVIEYNPKIYCKSLKIIQKYIGVAVPQMISLYKLTSTMCSDIVNVVSNEEMKKTADDIRERGKKMADSIKKSSECAAKHVEEMAENAE